MSAGLSVLAFSAPVHAATFDLGAADGFTVLGLNDGTVIINSATSIIGDVGYSQGVTSGTNQKVDSFTGTARVHSGVTSFIHAADTFQPTGGIVTNAATDALLDQANADAAAAAAAIGSLIPTSVLGDLGDNDSFSVGAGVYSIGSLDFKEDTITLTGSATDIFIFNVSGSFDFSNSQIVLLDDAIASNVIFNFLNAVDIKINKEGTDFRGTILAPTGNVVYHNPATLKGSIIAKNIDLHSDFNIEGPSVTVVPAPFSLPLLAAALGVFGLMGRAKRHL